MNKVIDELNQLLSDAKVFEQNVYNYHWNIRGKHFLEYHEELGDLYEAIGADFDAFAERILQLGGTPISKMSEYLEKSNIEEEDVVEDVDRIIELVVRDLYKTVDQLNIVRKAAVTDDDEATNTLMGDRLLCTQKFLWMYSSAMGVDVNADDLADETAKKESAEEPKIEEPKKRVFKRS